MSDLFTCAGCARDTSQWAVKLYCKFKIKLILNLLLWRHK